MTARRGQLIGSIVAAALLLAVWLVPASAQFQGPHPGARRGGWGAGLMLGVPLHSLNLTSDQQTQVKSILSTYRAGARPIIQQLRQAQNDLSDKLLAAGPLQAGDVQAQVQQINQARAQLLALSSQATIDVRSLLTPDQLSAAAQIRAKLKDLRSQMRQLLAPGTTSP